MEIAVLINSAKDLYLLDNKGTDDFIIGDASLYGPEFYCYNNYLKALKDNYIERIYFGNELCHKKLPSMNNLKEAAKYCASNGLKLSVVCPPIFQSDIIRTRKFVQQALKHTREFIINDIGYFSVFEELKVFPDIAFGRLLNKMKKLSRWTKQTLIRFSQCQLDFFQKSSYSNKVYEAFFEKYGISSLEFDQTSQGIILPDLKNMRYHIYYPYSIITLSRYCLFQGIHQRSPDKFKIRGKCKNECKNYYSRVVPAYSQQMQIYNGNAALMIKIRDNPVDYFKARGYHRIILQPTIPA